MHIRNGGGRRQRRPLRRVRSGWTLGLIIIVLTSSIGCYSYRPSAPLAPPPEAEVRVELTPDGMTALSSMLGPRVLEVQGRVVAWRPDSSLELSVETIATSARGHDVWQGEGSVVFPSSAIASVQRRTFDRRRTIVVSAVAIAATAAIAIKALKQGILGGGPGGGGPPPN